MHFDRFCDRNLQLSLLFSPLGLREGNGPPRGTLAIGISLAFAQSLTPYPICQCRQGQAAFHPWRPGTFG